MDGGDCHCGHKPLLADDDELVKTQGPASSEQRRSRDKRGTGGTAVPPEVAMFTID